MIDSFLRRLLSPILTLRDGEAATAAMMFIYSFLVMTAYNSIKPSATAKFIGDVGADNLPWVMLVAGVGMGVIMQYYSRLVGKLPRLWVLPGTLVGVVGTLVGFWFLFQTGQTWVSVAFYFWGRLLLGIFLISQFWTLANDIYDPRQAKRIFGFIGGGASLGGMTGAGLTSLLARQVGTDTLILFSAGILAVCFVLVVRIQRRVQPAERGSIAQKETLGGGEAWAMLRQSKHLRLISLVIGFAALGAVTVEQQLNMAAEQFVQGEDSIVSFLAQITFYLSAISFVIQVYFTSRIHRFLGIGFALMVLPMSLGASALLILFHPVLLSTMVARITDTSLRYSLDKTTREVLFQPLPKEIKLKAKAFVDVTADRFIGKGLGSVILLVMLKVFGFTWVQLSFLSLTYCVLWLFLARKAKKEYTASFRRSIEHLELEPVAMRPQTADAATVETLIEELGSAEEHRVLYAIELLDSLDKANLITPLLLHHEAPAVRARALAGIAAARPELVQRWAPTVERALKDESADVRAAAVTTLAAIRGEKTTELMRPYLNDHDPRIVVAAAVVMAGSDSDEDVDAAESALRRLSSDTREGAAGARRQAARAIAQIQNPRFRSLLIPLMYDANHGSRQGIDREREPLRYVGLHVRAVPRLALASPPSQEHRPPCAGQLRRGSPRRAGVLPEGPRRKPGGETTHSRHARPHPVRENGGYSPGSARRRRRLHPLQNGDRPRADPPRASRARDRSEVRGETRPPRCVTLLQLSRRSLQSIPERRYRVGLTRRSSTRGKDAASTRPGLRAARAHLSLEGTSPRHGGRSNMARPVPKRVPQSTSTTCSAETSASV